MGRKDVEATKACRMRRTRGDMTRRRRRAVLRLPAGFFFAAALDFELGVFFEDGDVFATGA